MTSFPPIGVIAEDDTDCDVIAVLVRRILPSHARVGVRRRRNEGCFQLRRKAAMWMKDLAAAGCTSIVLLHDRDREDEANLRGLLKGIPVPTAVRPLICIPVEELEAWFWSDPKVVAQVGRGKGKALREPHLLADPKGALLRLSRDAGKKPLYSVNQNRDLAEILNLTLCETRCRAFRDLKQCVLGHALVVPKMAEKRVRRNMRGKMRSRGKRQP